MSGEVIDKHSTDQPQAQLLLEVGIDLPVCFSLRVGWSAQWRGLGRGRKEDGQTSSLLASSSYVWLW